MYYLVPNLQQWSEYQKRQNTINQSIFCSFLFALAAWVLWDSFGEIHLSWGKWCLGAPYMKQCWGFSCIRNRKHFKSRIKATWKLNGTWRCLLHIWASEMGKLNSYSFTFMLYVSLINLCWLFLFFFSWHPIPRSLFFSFPVLCHCFHLSFSIIEYSPSFSLLPIVSVSSLFCAIPSPSRRGGKPTSFSPRPWLIHLPSSGSFLTVF